jgi:hypothetical protein
MAGIMNLFSEGLKYLAEGNQAFLLQRFNEINAQLGESERTREMQEKEIYYLGLQHERKRIGWDGRELPRRESRYSMYENPTFLNPISGISWVYRKPWISYNLCHAIVSRFTAMLFGASSRPLIKVQGVEPVELINEVWKQSLWWQKWRLARDYGGALGTVVVGVRLFEGQPRIDVLKGYWCNPIWKDGDRDTRELERLEILFKRPIAGTKPVKEEWYLRIIDGAVDIVATSPINPDKKQKWEIQSAVEHNLGFVPYVWVQNDDILGSEDGLADCEGVYDLLDAIDALLSDAFQAIHYNADPTLIIKSIRDLSGINTGSTVALQLGLDEDAKFLELEGSGAKMAIDLAVQLRDAVLQTTRCLLQDVNPSGRTATEVQKLAESMYQRVDEFRDTYGEAIARVAEYLFRLIAKAQGALKSPLDQLKVDIDKLRIEVDWPPHIAPTTQEKQQSLAIITGAKAAGLISEETAIRKAAHILDIENVDKEIEALNQKKEEYPLPLDKQALGNE